MGKTIEARPEGIRTAPRGRAGRVVVAGRRVVELDSDDSDTQGVRGNRNTRFVSDPLHFTGVDLGEGMARSRRSRGPPPPRSGGGSSSEFHTDSDSNSGDESDNYNSSSRKAQVGVGERENALVESALARIRRAQARGKKDVKLNQEELAALERRRERMQDEEHRRLKEREQRFAVPIAQLEPPPPRKRSSEAAAPGGSLSRMPGAFVESVPGPRDPSPDAPRSRPRSGTASARPTPPPRNSRRDRSVSPFRYSYVNSGNANNAPPAIRHTSDTAPRPRSTAQRLSPREDWVPNNGPAFLPSLHPARTVDPFQYMTGGPHAPYHSPGAPAARRNVSGPPADAAYYAAAARTPPPAAARGSSGRDPRRFSSEGTSEGEPTEDDSASDERGHGARVVSRNGPDEVIVVEDSSPEPTRTASPPPAEPAGSGSRAKKASSPIKRKPVGPSKRRKKTREKRGLQ